jgi:two-component system cell cycle response regulator DivK
MARILFVDDDLFTLDTYKTIISFFGHDPILADTATQANEIAHEQSPDVIILDMNLPDMHGLDLLRQLKKDPQTANIPVIMVSASADAMGDRAVAGGAHIFLSKPVRPEKLVELIEEYTAQA